MIPALGHLATNAMEPGQAVPRKRSSQMLLYPNLAAVRSTVGSRQSAPAAP